MDQWRYKIAIRTALSGLSFQNITAWSVCPEHFKCLYTWTAAWFAWRKTEKSGSLHNEVLHNLYSSPNITAMRWTGRVAHMGMRNGYNFSVEEPEGKRPLRHLGVNES